LFSLSLLEEKGLEEYELAALANLSPEDPDEAKALIPTLGKKFNDEELSIILKDLASFRRFE